MVSRYNTYYFKGSMTDTLVGKLSKTYGMIFCTKHTHASFTENGHDYYDPVRRRYIQIEKKNRKNILLKYYFYDFNLGEFIYIDVSDNKKYSKKFFSDNFTPSEQIWGKLNILNRKYKIEKLIKNINYENT